MATDLRDTALNPNMPMRRDQLAQMTATPRSPRLGFLADAMMALKEFGNRVQVPAGVPLLGGEGVGSLLLGKAPEELVEMSYGNMPMRINPYAGQTASFVPEMKPGRGAQVADLLSLAPTPGGARAAAGLAGMADMGAGAERAVVAYHGTPHTFAAEPNAPLGQFRASKIGTGEGAQAFGHGLYFAENRNVADWYRKALSPREKPVEVVNIDGESFKYFDLPKSQRVAIFDLTSKNLSDVDLQKQAERYRSLAQSERSIANQLSNRSDLSVAGRDYYKDSIINKSISADEFDELAASYESLIGKKIKRYQTSPKAGSLYTVDIEDEAYVKMLDWDKPFSKQPKEVQKALKDLNPSTLANLMMRIQNPTGESIHSQMRQRMSKPEVAARLQEAGIPGVTYFDAGSRGNPYRDSRNIVVFPGEEQNVKILSRE